MKLRTKLLLLLLPIAAALTALCLGRVPVTPGDVLRSVSAHLSGSEAVPARTEMVLWNIRFPRILLGLLVGAGLSVSGCAFQSLFSNPLAAPDTLGIASGAGFGAALAILLGLSALGIQLLSILGGLAAVLLTILAGLSRRQRGLSGIVLAGIMIGSLFSALISLVKFTADTDNQLPAITYFLMGSLTSANYRTLSVGAPIICIGMLILYLLRWRMNLLGLTKEEAGSLGVDLTRLRAVVIICATAVTASCISMCGQVGWVGLIVPHLCRMCFGSDHLKLMPAVILLGSTFMVLVDTAARSISAAEIPVSVLTAVIGAPFFILLMRKTDGEML